MTQELLGRVHRELIDVLKSINQDEIHDDGHDFHKLLKDVEKALAQPEQEPVELPCCGYTDASAVKWNSFNGVVQCHNCGQTYTPPAPQRTEQEHPVYSPFISCELWRLRK